MQNESDFMPAPRLPKVTLCQRLAFRLRRPL